jgi:hypothetical protein
MQLTPRSLRPILPWHLRSLMGARALKGPSACKASGLHPQQFLKLKKLLYSACDYSIDDFVSMDHLPLLQRVI